VSLPAAGKALTAAQLAADFGPNTAYARDSISCLERSGCADPVSAYYSLLLDCLAARATGAPSPNEAGALGRRLSEYALPSAAADIFKDLYLQLFPRAVRHGLGEYYTPDWLAEKLLASTLGADLGDPSKRILDPACGSGTFLVLQIKHVHHRVASGQIAGSTALDLILRNIVGLDVHPLAVKAARVNYLLALGDLLPLHRGPIEVPVYQADSLLSPPPPFAASCDFLIGNPPWVNWQDLDENYRRATMPLWKHYGLFPKRRSGMQTILGAAKYDLSMVMIYRAADCFLRHGGRLGFIVSQTLFKAAAAGEGFRRFCLPDGTPLDVRLVEDFVKRKPFDSASNRTATLVLEKGRATEYPVEYRYHTRQTQHLWHAQPIGADPASPWISARRGTLAAVARILGPSPYRAREGVNTGGANAVFWISVMKASPGRSTVRNITQGARKLVPATQAGIESCLIYPLLRGQNVARWGAIPEHSILITHRPDMKLRAIPEAEMRRVFPLASAYLQRFESMLRQRPAFKRYFNPDAPFYSLFNIGEYTFAPWKVVWREQALPFTAAVVGSAFGKIIVPDHKLMIVPLTSEAEAHYVCAVLNSLPVSAAVAAYTIETQIDTHVLDHIAVPRFDSAQPVHRALASASRRAHSAREANDLERLQRAETAIAQGTARLWGLSRHDLAEMRLFLREAGVKGA
jgi:methylase of polypeptide subunit release factors